LTLLPNNVVGNKNRERHGVFAIFLGLLPICQHQEAEVNANAYCIINETTEDRFDETDNLADAIRIARTLVRENSVGGAISIEHHGRVIRQLVLMPDGRVREEEIR